MPAVQSTYLTNIAAGKIGLVADMTQADLISRTVETAGGIPFGSAVAQGAADKGAILYAGTGFLGVAVRDRSVQVGEQFSQYESARILKKGPLWVAVAAAVAAGAQVYLTAGGVWTSTVGSNFLVPGARFDTSTAGAGLAIIFIK
jgi:hypothetical protein